MTGLGWEQSSLYQALLKESERLKAKLRSYGQQKAKLVEPALASAESRFKEEAKGEVIYLKSDGESEKDRKPFGGTRIRRKPKVLGKFARHLTRLEFRHTSRQIRKARFRPPVYCCEVPLLGRSCSSRSLCLNFISGSAILWASPTQSSFKFVDVLIKNAKSSFTRQNKSAVHAQDNRRSKNPVYQFPMIREFMI